MLKLEVKKAPEGKFYASKRIWKNVSYSDVFGYLGFHLEFKEFFDLTCQINSLNDDEFLIISKN